MPDYLVALKAGAEKEFFRLPDEMSVRILAKIEALAANPRPRGSKKLRGASDVWRIRIGDYRVVYLIDDVVRRVEVTRIAHRRDVYRG